VKNKYLSLAAILLMASVFLIISCHKDPGNPGPVDPPDQLVTASLEGLVLDGNGMPVANASVTSGSGNSTATDMNGRFRFSNIKMSGRWGFVKVVKTGFFTGSRSIITNANASNFIEIELLSKTPVGDFSGASGGKIDLPSGSSVSFAGSAVVNAAGNSPYTGNVHVYASYLDPTREGANRQMPGDLRGISAAGRETGLQSYGMMVVELEGDGGEKLQIAPGRKASIRMAIPASLQGSAPASIPLWHFDDSTGKWMEEGSATRDGNNYVGQVGHFSFWNCDAPCGIAYFQAHIKDQHGNPVAYADLEFASEASGTRSGHTDQGGYVQGWLVKGQSLTLKVKDECGNSLYTQNIGVVTGDVDLGTITVTMSGTSLALTGAVVDCSGQPVTDGFFSAIVNGHIYRGGVTNGHFSIAISLCAGMGTDIKLTAVDLANASMSEEITLPAASGVVDAGVIHACGTPVDQWVRCSIGGSNYYMASPLDDITAFKNSDVGGVDVFGFDVLAVGIVSDDPLFSLQIDDLKQTGVYPLREVFLYTQGENSFFHNAGPTNGEKSVTGTITNTGSEDGWLEGSFSGQVSYVSSLQLYPVSGSFKVKRNF
jgi:hypothetical protein